MIYNTIECRAVLYCTVLSCGALNIIVCLIQFRNGCCATRFAQIGCVVVLCTVVFCVVLCMINVHGKGRRTIYIFMFNFCGQYKKQFVKLSIQEEEGIIVLED